MNCGTMEKNNTHDFPYNHKGAEILFYLSNRFVNMRAGTILALIVKRLNQFLFHVNIPPQVKIGRNLQLPHGGFGVVMHSDTVIGENAIIFHNVTIANGGARIGNRVYIGTGAVIIGQVNIGDDVTIGANTVVNFDIPSGATVVGQKARILMDSANEDYFSK